MIDRDLVTIHKPLAGRDRNIAVFYLHGGGLLYGERDDLPLPYVNLLTEAGYTLICADYPLAPEYDLPHIVESVYATWANTVATSLETGTYRAHFLFGRSSGAYLSLLLTREIKLRASWGSPIGVLDFYGYHTLCDQALSAPARSYTSLPEISLMQVDRIRQPAGTQVTSEPKPMRYALYVYARQHANAWYELLGLDEHDSAHSIQAWSLSDEDILNLPPLFITASTGDGDVPFRISKALSRRAQNATMKPVYYLPHDFDRNPETPEARQVYEQAIDWMGSIVDSN